MCLQWDEEGKAVIINTRLYEEEIREHQHLLLALQNFRNIAMMHGLLCAYGFRKMAKARGEMHVFQHPDFTRKCIRGGSSIKKPSSATLQTRKTLKRKQKRDVSSREQSTAGECLNPASPTAMELFSGKQQHARGLYQYINSSLPEFNTPSEDTRIAQVHPSPSTEDQQASSIPPSTSSLQPAGDSTEERFTSLTAAYTSSSSRERPVIAQLDQSTQDGIERMLSICATSLVPPLSPPQV
ncbi:hypothetical protein HHUSO_G21934 [Huso huso]|uniref:HSF-type DNA-binding domain-containing protein n=1 Tax=Huso huso TaxID=61971 RepID=A0ABR0YX07_HUSHU